MVTAVICGGSQKLDSEFLEAVSVQLMRARSANHRVEISLDLVQGLIGELIRRRRLEADEAEEIEKIVSSLAEEGTESDPRLLVSESRKVPDFHFDGLEITDLDQLDVGSSYDETEDVEEEEEEIEVVRPPVQRRTHVLRSHRKTYWVSSLNFPRVLAISLLGFLVLAGLVLLGG
jgi:hypothetical protein